MYMVAACGNMFASLAVQSCVWRSGPRPALSVLSAESLAEGRQVDQFWGSDPRQLQDRVWLHADAFGPDQVGSVTAAPGHNRGRADMLPTQSAWPE